MNSSTHFCDTSRSVFEPDSTRVLPLNFKSAAACSEAFVVSAADVAFVVSAEDEAFVVSEAEEAEVHPVNNVTQSATISKDMIVTDAKLLFPDLINLLFPPAKFFYYL
jgi:hypothetical protein